MDVGWKVGPSVGGQERARDKKRPVAADVETVASGSPVRTNLDVMRRPVTRRDPTRPVDVHDLSGMTARGRRHRAGPDTSTGREESDGSSRPVPEGVGRRQGPSGKGLDAVRIRAIAEDYVARRECSVAMLRSVFERRIQRACREMEPERAAQMRAEISERVEAEIARLRDLGFIDDARFAVMRARRDLGRGRGARRILTDLAARGVDPDTARAALDEAGREMTPVSQTADDREAAEAAQWAAALRLARRRRIGPWRQQAPSDHAGRTRMWRREAGILSRAGFEGEIIRAVLDLQEPPDEAVD